MSVWHERQKSNEKMLSKRIANHYGFHLSLDLYYKYEVLRFSRWTFCQIINRENKCGFNAFRMVFIVLEFMRRKCVLKMETQICLRLVVVSLYIITIHRALYNFHLIVHSNSHSFGAEWRTATCLIRMTLPMCSTRTSNFVRTVSR